MKCKRCGKIVQTTINGGEYTDYEDWCVDCYKKYVREEHSVLKKQVGGNHYKEFEIQPVEFIHKNKLGFIEGNIIKYVCRHRHKGGKQDLLKAKHYLEMLIDFEYGGKS